MSKLQRTTFKSARTAEYIEASQLQAVTGQAKSHFATVVVKELVDNALDACEEAGVAPEVAIEASRDGGEMGIVVSDNGSGIPPDTVRDALNFDVRVSDKAAYRSPTRGAQGNALKTVFGIPPALGSLEPVAVEAWGLRHDVRLWKDLAGELRVQCDETPSPVKRGTRVALSVPEDGQDFKPGYWTKAFALFNPHAAVRIARSEGGNLEYGEPVSGDSYRPTRDPAKRFKYVPSDPTSAHWYDAKELGHLIFSHNAHARDGGRDLPLREFVRQFKGLSSTSKAKAVCDHMPAVKTLADFEAAPEGAVPHLLRWMRVFSDAPSHNVLGAVGREHFEQRFEEFYGDVYGFGYKRIKGRLPTGLPYIFEFAVAELDVMGHLFTGVNFSPTFGDPLAELWFKGGEYTAHGVENFLLEGFVHPERYDPKDPEPPLTAAAMHVITPAPMFLDRGKTRLEGYAHPDVGGEIGRAMFGPIKPFYKEGRRRVRGRTARERAPKRHAGAPEVSFKEAIYASMEQAVSDASSGGEYPFSARDLFYAVRPLYVGHTEKRLDPEKGYDTFKGILDAYQDEHGKIAGLYYDPRGRLREPHTGRTVDVGTREIEAYSFPHLSFDKILYIEKEGIWPQLEAHNLGERYDMAILTGKGYATEAARTLFEKAEEGDYQLFVLHDADPDGYNIARTLREETRRMRGYNVQVIDIGLTVEDAEDRGLLPETFTRRKALPSGLTLNERELACFEGRYKGQDGNGKRVYECTRYEINALKTAPQKIAYIEEKLEEKGVRGKVIPPADELPELAYERYLASSAEWVADAVRELVVDEQFTAEIADKFAGEFGLDEARRRIEARFEKDRSLSWRKALEASLEEVRAKHSGAFKAAVEEKLRERLGGE
jgi:hypothetical protein